MALRINPQFRSNFDQLKSTSLEQWVEEQVYKFLGGETDRSDEIDACLTLDGPALEKYIRDRFGSEGKHLHFIKELAAKKRRAQEVEEAALEEARKRREITSPDDPSLQVYVKPALEDDDVGRKKGKKGKAAAPPKVINATPATSNMTVLVRTKSRHQKGADAPVMVKGRMRCDCEAKEHPLVQNCIQCGRIVCEAEGVGECLFCGSMVYPKGSHQAPLAPEAAEDFFKAVSHRNKLLDYQRNQARRTLVYDDQADYFSTNNSWMSADERAYAQKKEADRLQSLADKRKVRVNFDFAGRRVLMSEAEAPVLDDDQVFADLQSKRPSELVNPSLEQSPIFTPVLPPPSAAPAARPAPILDQAPAPAPASGPKGKLTAPESRAGAVRQQAKGRVQYDFYSYNLEEADEPAAQAKSGASAPVSHESAFKICGVAENFSGGLWTLDERRRVLQLMGQKRMSHYLYAPADRLQASHGWSWRAAIPLDSSDLPALGAAAAQHHVQLNYTVPIGPLFDFASETARANVVAFCLAAVRAGVRHLTLWLDPAHAAGEEQLKTESGSKKNAGLVHGDVCNRIIEAVRKAADAPVASSLCFYFSGAHSGGRFELAETMSKQAQYYLRDIHQTLASDVRLLLSEGEPVAKSLTNAYAQGARSFFGPKRTLILLDHYPANDYCPQVTFLHPYDGRDIGLENYVDGLLCTPMRRIESTLLPLATAFDYMRSSSRYEPVLSLRDALSSVLPDDRLQADMLELIGLSPSPISSTLVDATSKPVTEAQFTALRQKIGRVRSALPSSLSDDLSQFFILMDAYVEANLRELEVKKLRAQKSTPDVQKRLSEAEREFQSARKKFDGILKPVVQVQATPAASPVPSAAAQSPGTATAPSKPAGKNPVSPVSGTKKK